MEDKVTPIKGKSDGGSMFTLRRVVSAGTALLTTVLVVAVPSSLLLPNVSATTGYTNETDVANTTADLFTTGLPITTGPEPILKTRVSAISGTNDEDTTNVTCADGEVMLDCSSYLPASRGKLDGEYILVEEGVPRCYANNGYRAKGAVAYARCATWHLMECEYITGPHTNHADDATSTAMCSEHINGVPSFPTGCMAHSLWDLDGGFPASERLEGVFQEFHTRGCVAQNGSPVSYAQPYAACCAAPGLYCKIKWSEGSGSTHGAMAEVSCEDEWIMTGCSAINNDWKQNDGSYISEDDICRAKNGGGNNQWAIATCCKQT